MTKNHAVLLKKMKISVIHSQDLYSSFIHEFFILGLAVYTLAFFFLFSPDKLLSDLLEIGLKSQQSIID